jgi:hypothetical protein
MVGYCSGKSLHYYSVVTRFDSLPDHLLSRLRFSVVFISRCTQVQGKCWSVLRYGRFRTNPFPFIIHSTIRRYMPVMKTMTEPYHKNRCCSVSTQFDRPSSRELLHGFLVLLLTEVVTGNSARVFATPSLEPVSFRSAIQH